MTKPQTGIAISLLTAAVLAAALWPAIGALVGSFGEIRMGRAPRRLAALTRSQVLLRFVPRLAEAREQMARRLHDGEATLRVGELELGRASQLALWSYERLPRRPTPAPEDDRDACSIWQASFLRKDPSGCLERAATAAKTALNLGLVPHTQCRALLVLARARGSMGDLRGQISALREAIRSAPGDVALRVRLAEACRQAGR